MEQRTIKLYMFTALVLCLGIVIGTIGARGLNGLNKKYFQLTSSTSFRESPTMLAPEIRLQRNAKLLVTGQIDFTDEKANYPTVIKLKEDLKLRDAEKETTYTLRANTYYQVLGQDKNYYRVEATTDKKNTAKLLIEKKKAIPLEKGVWQQVRDSKGTIGWALIKK